MISKYKMSKIKDFYKPVLCLDLALQSLKHEFRIMQSSRSAKLHAEIIANVQSSITSQLNNSEFRKSLDKLNAKNLKGSERIEYQAILHRMKYLDREPPKLIAEKDKIKANAFKSYQEFKETGDLNNYEIHAEALFNIDAEIAQAVADENEKPLEALLRKKNPYFSIEETDQFLTRIKTHLKAILSGFSNIENPREKHPYGERTITAYLNQNFASFGMREDIFRLSIGDCRDTISTFGRTAHISIHHLHNQELLMYEKGMRAIATTLFQTNASEHHGISALGKPPSNLAQEAVNGLIANCVGKSFAMSQNMSEFLFRFEHLKKIEAKDLFLEMNQYAPSPDFYASDDLSRIFHGFARYEFHKSVLNGEKNYQSALLAWKQTIHSELKLSDEEVENIHVQDPNLAIGKIEDTYLQTIGFLIAINIYQAMEIGIPELRKRVSHGRNQMITSWLEENIFRHGASKTFSQILNEILDQRPNSIPIVEHFNNLLHDLQATQ